jgi:predicted negative regulator of RcsB-dependent stress response
MANHLDLEEQEQLDQLKHFWKQYGNLITWILIVVLGAVAGWNFYQYWQRSQASQAAVMFDELGRSAAAGDIAKLDRVFGDMKERFGSTVYAQQAGLIAAKQYYSVKSIDSAVGALTWVADQSTDAGYQAVARLRLADILAEKKSTDEALKVLNGSFPIGFEALVADRKADILLIQGKNEEAKAEYQKAFNGFGDRTEYRRLVEIKLNALGVSPQLVGSTVVSSEGKK